MHATQTGRPAAGLHQGGVHVAEGRKAGLTPKRLRGADLERPFHGVRLVPDSLGPDATADRYEFDVQLLAGYCDALELVLPAGAFFTI